MLSLSEVRQAAARVAEAHGMFVVSVTLAEVQRSVRVVIDAIEGIDLDTCAVYSREFGALLAPEIEEYDVEVSTAGIGCELVVPQQFKKFEGQDVEVLSSDGRKFKGILREPTGEGFVVEETVMVAVEGVKRKVPQTKAHSFGYGEGYKFVKHLLIV